MRDVLFIDFWSMNANAPIGIFDSGVGGLTVARAIHDILPNENILYFGDTAHLPYGDRSPALIRQYSKGITEFLLEKNCKVIVIACNSASANALGTVTETVNGRAEVFDVISPIAELIATQHPDEVVGVIGTKATINSLSYPKALEKANAKNKVRTLATPLLAPMIEEGFIHDDISRAVLGRYLERPELNGIELLVLGCTHYPIISSDVRALTNDAVKVIDPPKVVAERVRASMRSSGSLATTPLGDQHFYVSDLTEAFSKSTKLFFGEDAKLEEIRLWDH